MCGVDSLFNRPLCRQLIIFANSFGPDKARQNIGPNMDPIVGHSDSVSGEFFEKGNFEEKDVSRRQKKHESLLLTMQRVDIVAKTRNAVYSQICVVEIYRNPYYDGLVYSKTCIKRPLKNRQNKGLKDNW